MKTKQWHVVEFAGFFHLMDEPFYDAKDVLNADDVGYEQAKFNAELASKGIIELPTDKETSEWYDLNINHPDETASSAIYKFRFWLKERLQYS